MTGAQRKPGSEGGRGSHAQRRPGRSMIAPATLAKYWALKSPVQIGTMDQADRFNGIREKGGGNRASHAVFGLAMCRETSGDSPDLTNDMKTRRAAPAGLFCLLAAIRRVREWFERPAASLPAQWS